MDEERREIVQELRWDPILGEWVMVSNIRERRPWRPSGFCPFCPGAPETGFGWDVLILENRYPMLSLSPPRVEPEVEHELFRRAEAYGRCLVLVETPEHDVDDLSDLSEESIVRVLNAIRNEMLKAMSNRRHVYFLYFRNKGREIGVSLTHPHSQIYILPFIPSKILRELINSQRYFKERGECLFCRLLKAEEEAKTRLIYSSKRWIGFIPFFAHWPFEVHLYPRNHVSKLTELSDEELEELARALKSVLCGFKHLFETPMPYIMVLHQAPLRGTYRFYHLHFEIYGMYRTSGKLKYAAGVETGGGNFTYDSTPEFAASMLRKAIERSCRAS